MSEIPKDEMFLRDWFAAMAMQGFVASLGGPEEPWPTDSMKEALVNESYEIADLMMEQHEVLAEKRNE